MADKTITTLIFDFGGVLTYEGHLYKFLMSCERKYDKSLDEIRDQLRMLWDQARIGQGSSHDYWLELAKHFQVSSETLINDCMVLDGFQDEVYAMIKKLKGRYKLGMITNQIENWFEHVDAIYGFREVFDVVITSYESGMSKPDAPIYELALRKLDSKPSECIFIDDMQSNIDTARHLGMNVILFTDYQQLAAELQKFNIET